MKYLFGVYLILFINGGTIKIQSMEGYHLYSIAVMINLLIFQYQRPKSVMIKIVHLVQFWEGSCDNLN